MNKMSLVKLSLVVYILIFMSSGIFAGTLGLDSKKKEKEKEKEKKEVELSTDGPYVIYRPDGKTRIVRLQFWMME